MAIVWELMLFDADADGLVWTQEIPQDVAHRILRSMGVPLSEFDENGLIGGDFELTPDLFIGCRLAE